MTQNKLSSIAKRFATAVDDDDKEEHVVFSLESISDISTDINEACESYRVISETTSMNEQWDSLLTATRSNGQVSTALLVAAESYLIEIGTSHEEQYLIAIESHQELSQDERLAKIAVGLEGIAETLKKAGSNLSKFVADRLKRLSIAINTDTRAIDVIAKEILDKLDTSKHDSIDVKTHLGSNLQQAVKDHFNATNRTYSAGLTGAKKIFADLQRVSKGMEKEDSEATTAKLKKIPLSSTVFEEVSKPGPLLNGEFVEKPKEAKLTKIDPISVMHYRRKDIQSLDIGRDKKSVAKKYEQVITKSDAKAILDLYIQNSNLVLKRHIPAWDVYLDELIKDINAADNAFDQLICAEAIDTVVKMILLCTYSVTMLRPPLDILKRF